MLQIILMRLNACYFVVHLHSQYYFVHLLSVQFMCIVIDRVVGYIL